MTTKHVVADDVLGKIGRRTWELMRRVLEGSTDHERAIALLQPALEGIPEPHDEGCSWGTYLLECYWAWDNFHFEFATIGLEKCDSAIPFEDLLNPVVPEEKKTLLLKMLKQIYEAQVPRHGSYQMLRLYRVLSRRNFGYRPGHDPGGTLERDAVDVHLILKPVCDFNKDGEPVPCTVEAA